MREIWKEVPGYSGYYVSNRGRVRSKKYGLLKAYCGRGYPQVKVFKDGRGYTRNIHRLMCYAFYGPVPQGKCVNHIDGNKRNNLLSNLEVVTHSENNIHALRNGLRKTPVGSKRPQSKLIESEVRTIVRLISRGKPGAEIARKFNLSQPTISDIMIGRTWNHVTGFPRHSVRTRTG